MGGGGGLLISLLRSVLILLIEALLEGGLLRNELADVCGPLGVLLGCDDLSWSQQG